MVRILPQTFYEDPALHKVLVDGYSCIIHKKLDASTHRKEGFVATHAITLVMQGTLRLENDAGLFEEISAGQMVLLPKGLYIVSDILPRSGCFEALMFFFEPEIIRDFLASIGFPGEKANAVTHAVLTGNDEIAFFATSLLRLYGHATGNRHLTKVKLFELLHLVHASAANPGGFAALLSNLDQRERRGLRAFMEANFHKPLGIEDYAYLTGRSVSTFTRDFKAKFDGIPPKQWLIERRLEKARDLLSDRRFHQVSDVAWESGYENVPHFIKAFHKRFGITPKQLLIENRKAAAV